MIITGLVRFLLKSQTLKKCLTSPDIRHFNYILNLLSIKNVTV